MIYTRRIVAWLFTEYDVAGGILKFVPSVINRFIFCYGVFIYFIMQSSFEKISRKLTLFPFSSKKSTFRYLVYFESIRIQNVTKESLWQCTIL